MEFAPLKGWENFYVLSGTAAAGLTGLTFVVIALARDARRVNTTGTSVFVTPTTVHFTAVLVLAAFLCVPRLDAFCLDIGLGFLGVAGLAYVASIAWRIHCRLADYLPVLEDWAFNVILPGTAYAVLLAMGVLLEYRPEAALNAVAAASLLLLLVGIHNAWDIAVWMSLRRHEEPKNET